jgi:hypothetical protein
MLARSSKSFPKANASELASVDAIRTYFVNNPTANPNFELEQLL